VKILKIYNIPGVKKVNVFVFNLFVVLCLFILLIPTARKYPQSFNFVYENEFVSNAYLIDEEGYRVNNLVGTNLQPIPYLVSMAVQKVSQPVDVYSLISWHRMAIIAWSLGFSVLLIFRFGRKVIPFIIVFESIKYFTLGNVFVGESLVAYPLVYWFISFFELMVDDEFYLEDFLLGILSSLIILLMLPMALPLFVLTLLRYYFSKGKGLFKYLLGFLIPMIVVFLFVSPVDYFKEVFANGLSSIVPIISEVGSVSDFIQLFILPISTFFTERTILNNWISYFSFFWWFSILMVSAKRKSKLVLSWLILFVLWGMTNTRNLVPDVMYYEAFHLTPWLAVGIMMAILLFRKTWKVTPMRTLFINGLSLLVLIYLFFNPGMPWRM